MKRIFFLLLALPLLAGCPDKDKDKSAPSGSAAVMVTAKPDPAASGSSVPVPLASGSATKPPPAPNSASSWSGSYTLALGTLSIPTENKDYAGVKQFKDDPTKHMGDGKIDLTVTGDRVAGTVEGAAGPAIIDGSIVDGEIRGVVRRKDPKDDGLTGTITAKIAGNDAEGKLALADGTTAIIREAKIALKKK